MKIVIKGRKEKILQQILEELDVFEDEIITVTISNTRSSKQNAMLHALIREICDFIGEMDIELVKMQLKWHLGYVETMIGLDGGNVIIPLRTSQMSKEELAGFIEKLQVFSSIFLNFKL